MKALSSLMAIVDVDVAGRAGWTPVDLAAAYLDGGARLLQIRAKSMASGQLLETASAIVARARETRAQVIVNDRADIAKLSGADGVHVGQADLAPAAVRLLMGADATVGLSTHTGAELSVAVSEPISYVAAGPVFGSVTKATGYDAIGLAAVRDRASYLHAHRFPLVAIGGITLETASAVREAGADTVAVIADLLVDGDPARRVQAYLQRLTV